MKVLVLLTNFFPYGQEEPYLETEVPFYQGLFNRVIICSLQLRKNHINSKPRDLTKEFSVIPVCKLSFWGYFIRLFYSILDINYYREIMRLIRQKRFTFRRLKRLTFYLVRAHYEAHIVREKICKSRIISIDDSIVFYSYRFDYQPYVGLLLSRNFPNSTVISRGHGFDLYEFRRPENYIPLRPFLLNSLTRIFPVSNQGREYLLDTFSAPIKKVEVARLGTKDYGLGKIPVTRTPLRIVSCSTLSEVKRVHLIIQALSKIDIDIHWDHYGTGELALDLKDLAEAVLPKNVSYAFRGHFANYDLMQIYQKTPYHFFVNVSSSEGLPVSIMEAMSFGIPCIATDVGGTCEIVTDRRNGFLLRSDFSPSELAKILTLCTSAEPSFYDQLRKNAREDWELGFSARNNYHRFVHQLSTL